MRQVDQEELVDRVQAAIGRWPKSIIKGMADHRHAEQLRARVQGAELIAAALGRLEILSSGPPPPPVRYADLDGGSGVPMRDDIEPTGPVR